MKHKHHIIPRHMGGSNDDSNLIELTIEEHADAHKLLWEKHGKWEDYYAWQGLSGLIPKKELVKQIQSIANSKPKSEETKEKIRQYRLGKKQSEQSKQKISEKAKERWSNGVYDAQELAMKRRGFKQSQHQKDRARETLECAWLITSPEGITINIVNLRKFCRENNLDQGNLSRGKHKGWKCLKIGS
jgi:hypothetical protein